MNDCYHRDNSANLLGAESLDIRLLIMQSLIVLLVLFAFKPIFASPLRSESLIHRDAEASGAQCTIPQFSPPAPISNLEAPPRVGADPPNATIGDEYVVPLCEQLSCEAPGNGSTVQLGARSPLQTFKDMQHLYDKSEIIELPRKVLNYGTDSPEDFKSNYLQSPWGQWFIRRSNGMLATMETSQGQHPALGGQIQQSMWIADHVFDPFILAEFASSSLCAIGIPEEQITDLFNLVANPNVCSTSIPFVV